MLSLTNKLIHRSLYHFSSSFKTSLVNATPQSYVDQRQALKANIWRTPDPTLKRSQQTHLSNAEYLINKIPVVYSTSNVVRCVGGTQIGTGHPQVYIQLDTRQGKPVACKWCGMRYAYKHDDEHHH